MVPSAQPTSGVRASITPKIMPVRRASEKCGRRNAMPLPTAAAKASVDMAKARKRVEKKVMRSGATKAAQYFTPVTLLTLGILLPGTGITPRLFQGNEGRGNRRLLTPVFGADETQRAGQFDPVGDG